jgi:hypothetical protein
MVQSYIEVRQLLNAGQFGFRAGNSTTLQCMRLTDHVTLNLNNNIYGGGILGYRKLFDKTWHPGFLYKSNKNFWRI